MNNAGDAYLICLNNPMPSKVWVFWGLKVIIVISCTQLMFLLNCCFLLLVE
jgi:hypothetical protein